MNSARKYLLLLFWLLLLNYAVFFATPKTHAQWSTDTDPPYVTALFNCASPISVRLQNGLYTISQGGTVRQGNTVTTCVLPPNSNGSITVQLICEDVSRCRRVNMFYELFSGESQIGQGFLPSMGPGMSQVFDLVNPAGTLYQSPQYTLNYGSASSMRIRLSAQDFAGNLESQALVTPQINLGSRANGIVYVDPNQNCSATDIANGQDTPYTGTVSVTATNGTVLSAPQGTWSVTDITPGSSTITLNPPVGYSIATCNSASFTATYPPDQTHNYFITPLRTLAGRVCEERGTPDGDCNDATDVPLAGVPVTTTGYSNTSLGSYSINNRLGGGGNNYTLGAVVQGTYSVSVATPADYQLVNTSPQSITLSSDQTTVDFAFARLHDIRGGGLGINSGGIFLDTNDNNLYDATDPAFSDPTSPATINLRNSLGALIRTITPNANGEFIAQNLINGTYFVELPTPAGYNCVRTFVLPGNTNPALCNNAHTVVINNADATGYSFLVDGFRITGNVSLDYNHNAAIDAEDQELPGINLSLSGPSPRPATATNALGNYFFGGLKAGDYTINLLEVGTGYTARYLGRTQTQTATVPPDGLNKNFTVTPLYTISGFLFNDLNKNQIRDAGEPPIGQNFTVAFNATDPGINTWNQVVASGLNGSYTGGNIQTTAIAGTYTVSYTSALPEGYELTYPLNGPPPSLTVTVGHATTPSTLYECDPGTSNSASCYQAPGTPESGSIQNVNFGVSNAIPWCQYQGADARVDGGLNCPIPDDPNDPSDPLDTLACGGVERFVAVSTNQGTGSTTDGLTAGLLISGDNPYDFCTGDTNCPNRSSINEWIVGGLSFPETFTPVSRNTIRTSYAYMSANADDNFTPLADVCTPANCSLPVNLPNGIYQHTGNVVLNAYTFPNSRNYVFLINGTLTINGNIIVPRGSTATFSVSGNIIVPATVGVQPTQQCNPDVAGHPGCNIEGFYSTDQSFIVQGTGTAGCYTGVKDLRLNINGAVVVNASLDTVTPGGFVNNRDMCEDNLACPSYTIKGRTDFYLNAPEFIKTPNYVWQEVAP